MSEEKIANALGLRPLEEVREEEKEEEKEEEVLPIEIIDAGDNLPVSSDTSYGQETLDDIDLARSNLKGLLDKGNSSLDELIQIAKQSESPRAFEVVSTLMKTMIDANKEFVDMSQKKKYEQEDHGSPQGNQTNVTNNNLILSTTDLLKMIKGEIE